MGTRKALKFGLVSLLALGLVGGVAPAVDAQEPAPAPIKLRIGTQAPKGTPWGKLLRRMRKRIKQVSGGRLKVKIYWLGKLGSENKVVRRCQQGTVDGVAVSVGALGNAVPELNLIEAPYIFDTEKAAYPKLAKATPLVKKLMKAKGFTFVIWGENGMRHFMSKERHFTAPGMLSKVKMRSQPAKPHKLMYKALGATASTIAIGELKQSLSSNVVTGFDNSMIYAYATDLHSEIDYVTLSSHIYQPAIVAWCDKGVNAKVSEYGDLWKVIMDVPAKWEVEGRNAVRVLNNSVLPGEYRKAGKKIITLSASQKAAFKNATKGVLTRLAAETSAEGRELIQLLK